MTSKETSRDTEKVTSLYYYYNATTGETTIFHEDVDVRKSYKWDNEFKDGIDCIAKQLFRLLLLFLFRRFGKGVDMVFADIVFGHDARVLLLESGAGRQVRSLIEYYGFRAQNVIAVTRDSFAAEQLVKQRICDVACAELIAVWRNFERLFSFATLDVVIDDRMGFLKRAYYHSLRDLVARRLSDRGVYSVTFVDARQSFVCSKKNRDANRIAAVHDMFKQAGKRVACIVSYRYSRACVGGARAAPMCVLYVCLALPAPAAALSSSSSSAALSSLSSSSRAVALSTSAPTSRVDHVSVASMSFSTFSRDALSNLATGMSSVRVDNEKPYTMHAPLPPVLYLSFKNDFQALSSAKQITLDVVNAVAKVLHPRLDERIDAGCESQREFFTRRYALLLDTVTDFVNDSAAMSRARQNAQRAIEEEEEEKNEDVEKGVEEEEEVEKGAEEETRTKLHKLVPISLDDDFDSGITLYLLRASLFGNSSSSSDDFLTCAKFDDVCTYFGVDPQNDLQKKEKVLQFWNDVHAGFSIVCVGIDRFVIFDAKKNNKKKSREEDEKEEEEKEEVGKEKGKKHKKAKISK